MTRTTMLCLAGGMLVGLPLGAGGVAMLNRAVPVRIESVREVDGIAVEGGRIDLLLQLDRQRFCPSETWRWLWRWVVVDGKRVKKFVPLLAPSVPVVPPGESSMVLSLQIPGDIEPGDWSYGSRTEYRCSWLPVALDGPIRVSPDVPVHVIQPPAGAR